jgi:hypothetical protein
MELVDGRAGNVARRPPLYWSRDIWPGFLLTPEVNGISVINKFQRHLFHLFPPPVFRTAINFNHHIAVHERCKVFLIIL